MKIFFAMCACVMASVVMAGKPGTPVPMNPYAGMREREEVFAFARKPQVTQVGEKWIITFASKGKCDATVSIVGKDGRIVRHLASGVLGANAPWPFQQNSLSQKIEWDGKDNMGIPVSAGFAVRVGLGMRASFERFLYERPPGVASRGPVSLACDAQGMLYVMWGPLWVARLTGVANIVAFDREGNYLRTLKPFRADWPEERISAVDWLKTADGRSVPLTGPNTHRPYSGHLRGFSGIARHTAQITRDGRYIFVSGDAVADARGVRARRLLSINTDGSAPRDIFIGPPLPEVTRPGDLFLALSPDEKYVYVSGTYCSRGRSLHHAVYRLAWNNMEMPKPFVGTEYEAGKENSHFNQPRGLAVDPDGRLYVCDYLNDRIQVFGPDGAFLKTLDVVGPEQVVVHPKTRALYVLSVRDRGKIDRFANVRWEVYADKSLVKYNSWDDFREVARLEFPKLPRYFHDCGPILALDASGEKPIVWVSNVVRGRRPIFSGRLSTKGPN